jgi:UDP-N-acetylglucosamine diphosphorylase / glucose-1-phosphate thymidylyltransferase / UDP-N-acetylgalactosamine diphosphorylase / glucosamine-1-phosphate N-acetyltransferase / galactosamine-1-phosphate N-acetyltransferase
MNLILFDPYQTFQNLKPLCLNRPIGMFRIGIMRIFEKWEKKLDSTASFLTSEHLQNKFKPKFSGDNLYLAANVLPSQSLISKINLLENGTGLSYKGEVIAFKSPEKLNWPLKFPALLSLTEIEEDLNLINSLPDLFLLNGEQIKSDFEMLTSGRASQVINDKGSVVYNESQVFVEEDVHIRAVTINAENGPVYIGKGAIIQENSLIIGPACIGENAMVAFGAKIRYNTTLGPNTRVGGEVGNTIFFGHSNKAHDGFLGNSVIGEWCNLGANTNNSNLKNNYKNVSLYNYGQKALVDTGEVFCGVFMGDYTKTGISTMINTGSVFGVCCNVFGAGFQEKFIPSFSWGGKAEGIAGYRFDKAVEVINATQKRRDMQLSEEDLGILTYIFENKESNAI